MVAKALENPLNIKVFHIEGVKCSKCVSKLEGLVLEKAGIIESRYSTGQSTLTVTQSDLANEVDDLISWIESKGFKAQLIQNRAEADAAEKKITREWLTRLAITFALSGNIMMFSAALYTGAEGEWATLFAGLSGLFFIPIALYSAVPFYKSSLQAIKERKFNADLALVIAFIWGGVFSYMNLLRGSDEVYFDSTASFVFLILLTRYFLEKAKKKNSYDLNSDLIFGNERNFLKTNSELLKSIDYLSIEPNDLIEIKAYQTIPVDGQLISPEIVFINSAVFSGEGEPITLQKGQTVRAGQICLTSNTRILAQTNFPSSEIGKIFSTLKSQMNTKTLAIAKGEILTKYLLITVSTLAILTTFYFGWLGQFEEGFQRALALFTIACPCALSFAIPLASTRTLSLSTQSGLLVKSPLFFEQLLSVKRIVFDKTGTLTTGLLKLDKLEFYSDQNQESLEVLNSLAQKSSHPLSQSISTYLNDRNIPNLSISDYQDIPGIGTDCSYKGISYRIRKLDINSPLAKSHFGPAFSFYKDNQLLIDVLFTDEVRQEAQSVISYLKNDRKLDIVIASGDRSASAEKIAAQTQIEHVRAHLSPYEKEALIREVPSLMVGDGHNDSLAMAKAQCSLAVGGASSTSLAAAQATSTYSDLHAVRRAFEFADFHKSLVNQNLKLSLGYNILTGSAALLGLISPLAAAILMPINSFIVISATLIRRPPQGGDLPK